MLQILECRRFTGTYIPLSKERLVKDYEIDLELGNRRSVIIDGEEFLLRRGDVCIRKPGQRICGKATGVPITQTSILLTVDFSGKQCPERYSRNVEGPLQESWASSLLDDLGTVVSPYSEGTFTPVYRELLGLDLSDRKAANMLVMELIYKLNAEVCRRSYTQNKPHETHASTVLQYIRENLHREVTLEELADLVHLNKNYLVRLFRETYGQTPIKMLIDMRLEHACDLIANTEMPVAEIAAACGYSSASYFIAEYKKHFGITPLRQRQQPQ